jgi:uncharacterized protein YecT (DUF1311 family)
MALGIGAMAIVLAAAAPANDASAAKVNAGPPGEIAGTWDVERVAVDNEDGLHWEFKPDDPQLLGRTLLIDGGRVRFEDGKEIGCKQSAWPVRRTTWGFLFAKGFVRPEEGGRSPAPLPEDFALRVAKTEPATTYSLCPSTGKRASRFPRDNWVAVRGSDQLALHYDNQVLLLLRRRAPGAKPAPSFDCGKAETATEKAICGSFELASWDRSVALAFRRALERQTPQKQAELRQGQKDWLRKRDACGDKSECIDDQQWQRVSELVQQ